MRFRQVHLDFHTSEAIPGIGAAFSKQQFQEALKLGHVDSITVFSKCHHGWAYHPSEANEIHPELDFDLLGAMIEAAHEIDVKTPVYLSAGLDEKLALRHPEWLIRDKANRTNWADGFLVPGYHQFCFNTPYLDVLIRQVEEVVRNYDADGIFLDIVGIRECYCHSCINTVHQAGGNLLDEQAMKPLWEATYVNYAGRVREAIDAIKPGLPVFHNGGHITRGRRDLAELNSHLELESLPTGGWGYDHFPLSARYAQPLGMPFLGMTGKFHTTWGEFGGFKHPNALRYEAALSIANGARCSIGDQLHPSGLMDAATYALIGEAYRAVEACESWCADTQGVADIALLSLEAGAPGRQWARTPGSDAGAVRMLLEGKLLFDVVDQQSDFTRYKVLLLPDYIRLGGELLAKVEAFLCQGGKVLATGESGLGEAVEDGVAGNGGMNGRDGKDEEGFAIDLGVKWLGVNPYRPDYVRPAFPLRSLQEAAYIVYAQGQQVELTAGDGKDTGPEEAITAGVVELGRRENPYFNREAFRFCSHQHAPSSGEYGGPGIVESASGIYIAWNVFEDYEEKGSLAIKELVLALLDRLLPDKTLATNLPAQGVVTLQAQQGEGRWLNHLLYAAPVRRGKSIEVIEDIIPLQNVTVELALPAPAARVYLAPQQVELPFEVIGGRNAGTGLGAGTGATGQAIRYTVPVVDCHQMVVIDFTKDGGNPTI